MSAIVIVPVTLARAKEVVCEWHSHHDPMLGHLWSTGAEVDGDFAGVVVVSRPIAPANQDGKDGAWMTLEVTRLCCKGVAHGEKYKNVASRLLGAACASAEGRGVRLMLSYTRIDEDGTCYRAAGWVPRWQVEGRDWTSGNKKQRWLPGLYEPTTEKIDRIRWEWRPSSHIKAVCKMVFALGRWARATERKRAA